MRYHSESVLSVCEELRTGLQGLTREEAKKRLETYGANEIATEHKFRPILLFIRQFRSFFVYILFGALAISYIIGNLIDVYVILGVIVLNAVLGFVQERKAETAVAALRRMLTLFAKVFRDGETLKVPARELVPGDVILLSSGDRVPADARILESRGFRVNEAALTGESFPEEKNPTEVPPETPLADRTDMVWMGTVVVAGEARAVVVATGEDTEIGKVASSLRAMRRGKTHFEKKANELALQMGAIAVFGAVLTFLIGFFVHKLPFFDIFLFSVASLVSGIPEGLPAVLTIVLAAGAARMAKRNALVRHLPAVETLGVASVIAADKTGTITENSMSVAKILLSDGTEVSVSGEGFGLEGSFFINGEIIHPLQNSGLAELLHVGLVCNATEIVRGENGECEIIGDPTEAALIALGEKAGLRHETVLEQEQKLDELPFDEEKKYRSVLVRHEKTTYIYAVGAFEEIIKLSGKILQNGRNVAVDSEKKKTFLSAGEAMAENGMRVLGLAAREVPAHEKKLSRELVSDLTLLGIVGIIDPPRREVKDAVLKAKRAGIRIIMQTGDHAKTAVAVAREIGLIDSDVPAGEAVVTETELARLSEEDFDRAVERFSVFARVTPGMKLKILESLKRRGEIVAMTGDGVNDAPALKSADIGVAMGKIGTDVAREASEMVLADDNFASIVSAIAEGRVIFQNVRNTSYYLITTNIAEDVTIISSLLLRLPLPLLPVHVLWLNFITDGIPGATLSAEPGHGDELSHPPFKRARILSGEVIPFLIGMTVFMTAGTLFLFTLYLKTYGISTARTVAFSVMAFFQLFNILNMRSLKTSLFKIGFFTNPFVPLALAAAILFQLAVIYIPFLREAFRFTPLILWDWIIIIFISSFALWFGELYKLVRRKIQ